jgi:hypothetical protein
MHDRLHAGRDQAFVVSEDGAMNKPRTVIPIIQAKAVNPEDALRAAGWARQTTIGEPRLSEIIANYKSMGFEVHVEEYKADGPGCNTCFDAGNELGFSYGTVFIRKRNKPAEEDELF